MSKTMTAKTKTILIEGKKVKCRLLKKGRLEVGKDIITFASIKPCYVDAKITAEFWNEGKLDGYYQAYRPVAKPLRPRAPRVKAGKVRYSVACEDEMIFLGLNGTNLVTVYAKSPNDARKFVNRVKGILITLAKPAKRGK